MRKQRKFCRDLAEMAEMIAQLGAINSLAQTIVKCTAPGVPDFYQGTEIWDFSLVDPDNRREVDYSARRRLLTSLRHAHPRELLEDWQSGRIKLFLIQRLLARSCGKPPTIPQGKLSRGSGRGRTFSAPDYVRKKIKSQRLLVVVPRLTYSLGPWPTGEAWKRVFPNRIRPARDAELA